MINLPRKPKITKKEKNKSIFEIEALYPGYGITIGNSLRRVLFSSLEGAAITKVKIKGASHEFATLPGVFEDAITILLNLKRMRFKMYSVDPQIGNLNIKGEKEIKAGDFKFPSQLELINKDLYIAKTTDKKAQLEIEVQVEKGMGYEPGDKRKEEKLEIGTIAVDALFSPMKNVSFKVEDMRVGERTDFDRLILEIETDGTMTPEQAFSRACEILASQFSLLVKFMEKEKEKDKEELKIKKEKEEKKDISKIKIEELKLSPSIVKALQENKIKSVAGLIRKKEQDILEMKGLGEKALKDIKKGLKKLNLNLRE